MNRGTRLLMRTTTQPTKRSATSSVWIHKKVTGERPGGHNGWPWFLHGPLWLSSPELSKAVNRSTKRLHRLHAGVERMNDSIRTYVWAILGAQDEERTPILGSGTAFTAQKRFLTNVEAAIT